MKFTVDLADFAELVGWVAEAIPANPVMPVMRAMQLTAVGGRIYARAYDFETSHAGSVDAEIGEPGTFYVSGPTLRGLLPMLGRGGELEIEAAERLVTLAHGRSRYRLATINGADYPSLPVLPTMDNDGPGLGVLMHAINGVAYAVDDDAMPEYRGVRLEASAGRFHVIGSNSAFISVWSFDWAGEDGALQIPLGVIRAGLRGIRAVAARSGDLDGTDEPARLTMGVSENLLAFAYADREFTTRRIVAKPIPWRDVVRDADIDTAHTVINRAELAAALRRAAFVAGDESAAHMSIGADVCELSVSTVGGDDSRDAIDVAHDGEPVSRYMDAARVATAVEALGSLGAANVRLGFVDGIKPITIRPERLAEHPLHIEAVTAFMPRRGE